MSKQWKPVRLSDYYRNRIAKGISDNLQETMFKPIFEVLKVKTPEYTVNNSRNAIISALNSARIYYENGAFKAVDRFSNAVSKELEDLGAKFKKGAYYIERGLLPIEIDSIIAMTIAQETAKIALLNALLIQLSIDVPTDKFNQLLIEQTANLMFKKLEKDLIESTKEEKIPIVGKYIQTPDLDIAAEKIDEIEQYWQMTDEAAEPLHQAWKDKDDEVKQLEEQIRTATGLAKDELKKQLIKAKTERENSRQTLADFRYQQNKNAPNIDVDQDTMTNPAQQEFNFTDTDSSSSSEEKSLGVFKQDKWTKKIAQDYVYNMKFWVKKWKAQEIIKMRRDVLKMVQEGARIETIQKYFEKEWNIAKNKAYFLARNESELASSVVKAIHYQRMGCTEFMWLESNSKEKRELHLEYAKKRGNKYGIGKTNIFRYDDLPIIDEKTGQRGLPGQIYNCQCNQVGIQNVDYWINRRKIENAKRNIFAKIKYTIENSKQRNNSAWRYRRFGEGQAV